MSRGYSATHGALRAAYGPARDGVCEAPGCDQRADEWTLDPATPADRLRVEDRPCGWPSEPTGRRIVAYSVSLADYQRRCRHHHRQLDRHHHQPVVVTRVLLLRDEASA